MPIDNLTVESDEKNGILSVRISGFLNLQSMTQFRLYQMQWFESDADQILLDLSGLKFMDSSGLGSLVQGIQICRERNIDLKFLNVPKPFLNAMREIGLSGIV